MKRDYSKVKFIDTSDIWHMSTDEVIAVSRNTYSGELKSTASKALKSRKKKLKKYL